MNVRVFDGQDVTDATSVTLEDGVITAAGEQHPDGYDVVIDGGGGTPLPGLIDAHTHTSEESLRLALTFGVTTELEMQGTNTRNDRAALTSNDAVADVRSSGFAITPPGGHPSELFPKGGGGGGQHRWPGSGTPRTDPIVQPFASTPEEAVGFIPQLVAAGSDYIKFMVDDGRIEGHPGLPALDEATLTAGVAEAHRHGMLTIAHALTIDATLMAIKAGVDGLAHLFMDQPHTDEIVQAIVRANVFVVACVSLNASMMGITGAALAADDRVSSRLSPEWDETLRGSFNRYHTGRLKDVLESVRALHAAGVDVLVGTDVSQPFPFLGGLAHGASVHGELQYLVQAGLSPIDALRAATSRTADRFGLSDRGRIGAGKRADLLLVDGDPTTQITDTLNIRQVWRRGVPLVTPLPS